MRKSQLAPHPLLTKNPRTRPPSLPLLPDSWFTRASPVNTSSGLGRSKSREHGDDGLPGSTGKENEGDEELRGEGERGREELCCCRSNLDPLGGENSPQIRIDELIHMLDVCRRKKDRLHGRHLFSFIKGSRFDSHPLLNQYIISTLAEIGLLSEARQAFDAISCPNEWSWNSLITGFAKHGRLQDAFALYQAMRKKHGCHADATTIVSLLSACGKAKDFEIGSNIHSDVCENGLIENNIFVGSTLVDVYAKCGLLVKAEEVLCMLPIRNIFTWTALIGGYVEHGCDEEALQCFERMKLEGILPSAITFICILKACASIGDIVKGQEIHAELERRGTLMGKEVTAANSIINMYAKSGFLTSARHVFDRLPVRDVVSWTTLIAGYVEYGQSQEALECFSKMQVEGTSPDSVTYVCALKACINIGATDTGEELHYQIEKEGLLARSIFVASTLLDMYSKRGLLEKGQEVLDKVLVRNTIAWNALIAGYADCGQGEKTLEGFQLMQLEGILPDAVTYICCLKACGMLRAVEKGKVMHDEIEKHGFQEDLNTSNALVDMYAKCGFLVVAHQIFDKLPVHDIVSWNVLIAGYAEYGYGTEALWCFEQMQLEGFYPDPITLVCSLKCCSNVVALNKGMEIHMEIEKRGLLEIDLDATRALIDLYIKCGLLLVAQKLFDRLTLKDVVSYNALIAGYTEAGIDEEALTCFSELQLLGIAPDVVTYVSALKACATMGNAGKGKEIHTEIELRGFSVENSIVGNSLIDMYGKSGSIVLAQYVFDHLPRRDVISWTTLIEGYVDHGHDMEALHSFESMQLEGICPNATSFVCILKACSNLQDVERGREIHSEVEMKGLIEEDIIVGNALVDMYADCGQLDTATEVFYKLPVRDVVSWTALIAKCAEHGQGEEAFKLFREMQLDGISPDAVTLVCSLKACAREGTSSNARAIRSEIHAKLLEEEEEEEEEGFLSKNLFLGSTLVDMYAKCGLLAQARQVFDKLRVQNTVSWNALIAGYALHGDGDEALNCFDQMRLRGVPPDTTTFVSCLQACGSIGSIDRGLEMHSKIESQGLLERDLIGNTLVDMYAKCSALEKARQVFAKLPAQDVVSWTALMRGYAQSGDSENVFSLFHGMLEQQVMPDPVTFIVVLSACSRIGLSNKSWTYFEAMSRDYGISPSHEHHTCMVDLHGRSGQLDRAIDIIDKLPSCNAELWHSVMGACRSLGNMEVGSQIFGRALCSNERDSVAYVLMSQICGNSAAEPCC